MNNRSNSATVGITGPIGNRQSAIGNPLTAWSILAAGAVLFCGLIVAAPLALANSEEAIAVTLYAGFSRVCHQLSERSFYLAGHPLAVCSRCTGLYAGFTAALLIYPLVRSLRQTYAPARKWLFWAAAPMAIDIGVQLLEIWNNTHSSRFFSGALLGAVAVFYVMPGVIDLSLRMGRRGSLPPNNLPLTTTAVSTAAIVSAPSDYSAPDRRI